MRIKFRDLINPLILNEMKWIGFFGDSEYVDENEELQMGYWVFEEIINNYKAPYGRKPYSLDSKISEEELFNNSNEDIYVVKNDKDVVCGIRLIYSR